jgi:hypothetical protein
VLGVVTRAWDNVDIVKWIMAATARFDRVARFAAAR